MDADVEKHLKDLGASLASIQNELTELKKNPSANSSQINLLQKEMSELKGLIKNAGGPQPGKSFFETVFSGFYEAREGSK